MLFPSDSKRTGKKSHYKYKINHMKALWKLTYSQNKEIHINGKKTEKVYQLCLLFVADPISCLPNVSYHLFLADKIFIWLFIMNLSPRNNHDLYRKKKITLNSKSPCYILSLFLLWKKYILIIKIFTSQSAWQVY